MLSEGGAANPRYHPHPPPPAQSAYRGGKSGLGATSPPGRRVPQARGEIVENPPNAKYTDLTQEQAAIVHNYGS